MLQFSDKRLCQRAGLFCAIIILPLGRVNAWGEGDVRQVRERTFQRNVQPLLTKYCYDCHARGAGEGDIHLDRFETVEQVLRAQPTWRRVQQKVRNSEMPPADADQPSSAERQALADSITTLLNSIDCAHESRPGRVTLRRLNRVEYRNTVRDLVGVDYAGVGDFPADDVGYGFDSIADVLALPPLLLEKYLAAAESITARLEFRKSLGTVTWESLPATVERLATRAYRRPLRRNERQRLVTFAQAARERGSSPEESLQLVAQVILVSPAFLFRWEQDPPPGEQERWLDDYELATRLSYFLWSTMPDEELFQLAQQGRLHEDSVLRGQLDRMLASPRSDALVENFAAQWLELRKFAEVQISAADFPDFDEALRDDLRRETSLFFQHILRDNRSVVELLSGDYTFLNQRLARHYGIAGVQGTAFRRVSLAGTPRAGLITQGSVLTVTSNPTRTSPVKRGKWILENLLGEPPPPPPPNVPPLAEGSQAKLSGSLRQRLEQHRRDPACASCHESMDPLGFALENFNAVGAWRTKDAGFDIDASGQLPTGETFAGSQQLIQKLLNTRKQQFLRCLTEKLLTYALGRGLEYYDACAVDKVVAVLNEQDDRFRTLLWEIVRSDPFRKREGLPRES